MVSNGYCGGGQRPRNIGGEDARDQLRPMKHLLVEPLSLSRFKKKNENE